MNDKLDPIETLDWDAISNTLKFSKEVTMVLKTLPPAEQDVIRKALDLYIAEGLPAAFSQKPQGMSAERRRELLGYSGVGSQILNDERAKKTA